MRSATWIWAALFLVGASHSRSLERIRRDALSVGILVSHPPFATRDGSSAPGFEHDLAAEIARSVGVRFRAIRVSSPREGEELLASDRIDAFLGSTRPTPSLRDKFRLSVPYFRTGLGVMVRRSDSAVFALGDLPGLAVAATTESGCDGSFDSTLPGVRLELVRTLPEALRLLDGGEVRAVVHEQSSLRAEAARHPDRRVLDATVTDDSFSIVVAPRSTGLLEAVDGALRRLKTPTAPGAQPVLQSLCERYGARCQGVCLPGPPAKQTPSPPAPLPSAARPDDLERRLRLLELRVQELESRIGPRPSR